MMFNTLILHVKAAYLQGMNLYLPNARKAQWMFIKNFLCT